MQYNVFAKRLFAENKVKIRIRNVKKMLLVAVLVIHNGVTDIGYEAFLCCMSLTDVYYTGTEEEWASISIGSGNTKITEATIHYNYVPQN